ncbi:MAG TPA: IS110 family transposase [Chromatiales bacterium]|nr:IS110 family transposase [Thiotrichales bacterium]HIP67419.1 IS110 family transposase [Chromatiales bacterium]
MKAQVGIDVSKDTLDVCYLKNLMLTTCERQVFDNNAMGHKQLKKWLRQVTGKIFSDIAVTLEATGVYHLTVANLLRKQGLRVCVVNPLQAHHYAKGLGMRTKTDRLDSVMLARYGWERRPVQWQPAAVELIELKALNVRLDAVEKDRRREQNRLESATTANESKTVIRLIKQSIRALNKQVETLVKLIEQLIEAHDVLKKNRQLLLSIKGVGAVCSRYLVAEIYAGRFRSAAQCAAYMGLVPIRRQSGHVEKTGLSKAGNRRLKAKLYIAAISAKQHNPVLKRYYDQLIARGKCKKSALCAVMRRLVQISFGVIKHQKEFCLHAV